MPSKSSTLQMQYEARTAYSKPERFFAPSGDNTKEPIYAYDVNDKGQKTLVQVGTENLYEKIQSFHEETKIENILARLQAGDTTVLRGNGTYADVSEIPKDINNMYKERVKAENYWRTLDKETRAKFGHSFEAWINEAGQASWLEKMGVGSEKTPNAADLVPDVKPNTPTPQPSNENTTDKK